MPFRSAHANTPFGVVIRTKGLFLTSGRGSGNTLGLFTSVKLLLHELGVLGVQPSVVWLKRCGVGSVKKICVDVNDLGKGLIAHGLQVRSS